MLSNENSPISLCIVCCVASVLCYFVGQRFAFDNGMPKVEWQTNMGRKQYIWWTHKRNTVRENNGTKIYYQLEWTIKRQTNPFLKWNTNLNSFEFWTDQCDVPSSTNGSVFSVLTMVTYFVKSNKMKTHSLLTTNYKRKVENQMFRHSKSNINVMIVIMLQIKPSHAVVVKE